MKLSDDRTARTRASGVFLLLWSPVVYFLCDGDIFRGTDIDVRWILAVILPIAMILFPHLSWLQKD